MTTALAPASSRPHPAWVAICLVGLCATSALAALHGPIGSWYQDPTTTMTIQWLESPAGMEIEAVDGTEGEWVHGKAGFGFGDDDDATKLDMRDRFSRVYLRTAFDRPDGADPNDRVVLEIRFDDAFIAYLNGKEVARDGVGVGAGARALNIQSHEADSIESFDLGTVGDLRPGNNNFLAIEGHNTSLDSSDFSLDPALVLKRRESDKTVALIARNEVWEYLANAEPEVGWETVIASPIERVAPAVVEADPAPAYRFEFRQDEGGTWSEVELETRPFGKVDGATVFFADMEGLTPATSYQARLFSDETGDSPVREFVFETAPATLGDRLHFVTGGDMYHRRDMLDAMNKRAGELNPLFALLGGDLAYANGRTPARWYDWFDSWFDNARSEDGRLLPMVVAIGNHEVDGGSQPQPPEKAPFFYSAFKLPDGVSNYALDFADYMSLIILDSDHSQPVKDQTAWLEEALKSRSGFPYLFACYHRPTYGTTVKVNQYNVRNEWVPLFEEYRLDAAFENDHHVYKRSKLIYQDEENAERGVLYIGDGAWGVSTREIPQSSFEKLTYIEKAESTRHLLSVVLGPEEVAVEAIEADGTVIDEVTIPRRR
ncbi:hypothetical protein BH23VER1_BH23VER1_27210 [soil metagenome]